MNIGERIKSLRKQNGMTLQDVATRSNIQKPTVQRYASGVVKNIPNDKLETLAKLFGVTTDYLLGCDKHNTHFGSKLSEIRKEKHLTLEQLAQMYNDRFNGGLNKTMRERNMKSVDLINITGISKQKISQYVNGLHEPKAKDMIRIAKALKVDVEWLACGETLDILVGCENTGNAFSDNLRRLLNGEELKTRETEETSPKEEMLKLFDGLNTEGQKLAMKQMAFFASLPEFKKGSDNE